MDQINESEVNTISELKEEKDKQEIEVEQIPNKQTNQDENTANNNENESKKEDMLDNEINKNENLIIQEEVKIPELKKTSSEENDLNNNIDNEKVVKEKGPGIKNTILLNNKMLSVNNPEERKLIYSSSQSSLSMTEIINEENENDSDNNEFPTDFEDTTKKLLELKERIMESSKEMLKSSVVADENNDYSVVNNLKEKSISDRNINNENNTQDSKDTNSTSIFDPNIYSSTTYIPVYEYRKIFEYTQDEIKLFNTIEDYELTSKVKLNPDINEDEENFNEYKKLRDEQVLIYKKLQSTRNSLHKEMESHIVVINENKELKRQLQECQKSLTEKNNIINELQKKLNTEIENSKVYREEKKTVQDELEELTKSLFEEANKLVADEARKRHQVEKMHKIINGKLKDSQYQLEAETQQLKELREKMEEMNQENEKNQKLMEETNKRMSIISEVSDDSLLDIDTIDTNLLAEFKDFISSAINVRMSKLHNIPYMKNCLEDDIMPCLRFSSDPKISWKRLTEEIATNSLLLQEISHQGSGSSSPQSSIIEENTTPSSSISNVNSSTGSLSQKPGQSTQQNNNRSSMWVRLSIQAGLSSNVIFDPVFNGCQACGRPNSQSNPIRFQFRIDKYEKSERPSAWSPLCSVCRDRIVACCEFYNFIRHIRQGLYTNRGIAELYYESVRLKRQMFYARLGALKQSDYDNGFGKLPRLTQAAYNNSYRRSGSMLPARSEYGSSSSIIGTINSPTNPYQQPTSIIQAIPINIETVTTDSSQSSYS